ncbi:MAG: TonB-dependent receptor [Pseudomonadales bacterium]
MPALFKKAPLVLAITLATATSIAQEQLLLEEVIVTAQKRAESLQDVPISVTALQGEQLQDAGIPNMSAIAAYVPNLHIAEVAVNTNIYMRGMGSGNNQAFEQSVGMYIDGVYMGRGRQYRSPFVDIERVEVLRGPQGTLFGKNTVAGAINVTTASPDGGEELNGSLALSAEENGGLIAEGYISGSLSDQFAVRVGGKYRETDGFLENSFLNEDEPALEDTLFRITAVWQPSDVLDINLKYSYSDYQRTGAPSTTKLYLDAASRDSMFPNRSAFARIAYDITDANYPELATESQKEFTTFKDNNLGPDGSGLNIGKNPDSSDNQTDNIALRVDWELGGGSVLTSVTGWSAYESVDGVDVDWLPLQFISRDDDQEFEQFSQEFRITSPGGEFFDYVAGVYYEQSDLEFDRRVAIDTNLGGLTPDALGVENLLLLLTGGQYGANQIGRNHFYQLDSDSWAVFGQGTFNISDVFRVTLGLRYTEENKDVESIQNLADSNVGLDVANLDPFLRNIQATAFNAYAYNYNEDRSTDALIPSFNLQWDVFGDTMLYLTLSQGFKSGGFTSADDGAPGTLQPGEDAPYDPTIPNDAFEFEDEEVDALEIGGKHTLLGGGMTLNWAAFYTEYDNLQIAVFEGLGFRVTNAASTIVQGVEVDMMWQATENLRVGISGGWLDAEFDDFADAPCSAIQLDIDPVCGTPGAVSNNDLSGEETTYAPEYSASLTLDYARSIGSGSMEFFAVSEANYSDDFSPAGDNDPLDRIESYTKVNLRLGLRGDSWELMAFGRNIFDEEVFAQSFDVPVLAGSHARFINEGAVFGARVKYSF